MVVKRPNLILRRIAERIPPGLRAFLVAGVLRVCVFGFLAVVLYLLLLEMRTYVQNMEVFRLNTKNLRLVSFPDWADEEVTRAIVSPPGLPDEFSLLDDGICTRLAGVFEQCPWVDRVYAVERHYPNAMNLKMTLRRPAAFVRYGDRLYLVDEKGVRLPSEFRSWPDQVYRLPYIKNARGAVPPVGKSWQDEGVAAGSSVAGRILSFKETLKRAGQDFPVDIEAIDVANIGGKVNKTTSEIVLLTRKGTKIYWGRSPLKWTPGELQAALKLHNLAEVAKSVRLSEKEYVDIRFNPPVAAGRVTTFGRR